MHVLDYLADPKCETKPEGSVAAEYRLLCSGTLYRRCLGDWRKSDVARTLLAPPLTLFAASRPFDDHPLELVVRLTVREAREEKEAERARFVSTENPHAEVVSDLAALLTLLCRRLITVAGCATVRHPEYIHPLFADQAIPMALITPARRVYWPSHPAAVITSLHGQKVKDYNPLPKALDIGQLTALLLGLPKAAHAESIVAGCRLYALAMELIHERPDVSYPLLISSAETVANAALKGFRPADDDMVAHKEPVFRLAREMGLPEADARRLAIEACRGEFWATKKFGEFLATNVAESVWTEADDLYPGMRRDKLPGREELRPTLTRIYKVRSKATHEGKPFPGAAAYAGGPYLPPGAVRELYGFAETFPPVAWFERVVNSAISGYWERCVLPQEGVTATGEGGAPTVEGQPRSPG
jgi:hypothetical protein